MTPVLKENLPVLAADYLQGEIESGRIRGLLPGERHLCTSLKISRGTLRTALGILKRRKLVQAEPGVGTRTRNSQKGTSVTVPHSVGILSPLPLETHRLSYALLLDRLREQLQPGAIEIEKHYGPSFFAKNPDRTLRRLTKQMPHSCWILFRSTKQVQDWFAKSGLPCLVIGPCFPDIPLPFVAIDHRVLGRHAANLIMRHGHCQIGLLHRQHERPGLLHGREAFLEQCLSSHHQGVRVWMKKHDNSVPAIAQATREMLAMSPPPTVLLVENPNQYLTVQTTLQSLGLAVPRDISLLSRSDEPLMDFVLPPPVRYRWNPETLAKKIAHIVDCYVHDRIPQKQAFEIIPELTQGQSLGPPRE